MSLSASNHGGMAGFLSAFRSTDGDVILEHNESDRFVYLRFHRADGPGRFRELSSGIFFGVAQAYRGPIVDPLTRARIEIEREGETLYVNGTRLTHCAAPNRIEYVPLPDHHQLGWLFIAEGGGQICVTRREFGPADLRCYADLGAGLHRITATQEYHGSNGRVIATSLGSIYIPPPHVQWGPATLDGRPLTTLDPAAFTLIEDADAATLVPFPQPVVVHYRPSFLYELPSGDFVYADTEEDDTVLLPEHRVFFGPSGRLERLDVLVDSYLRPPPEGEPRNIVRTPTGTLQVVFDGPATGATWNGVPVVERSVARYRLTPTPDGVTLQDPSREGLNL